MLTQRSLHRPSSSLPGPPPSHHLGFGNVPSNRTTQSHSRRPSLTTWLAWTPSPHNQSQKSKIATSSHKDQRTSSLGSGAIVVRTPEEALTSSTRSGIGSIDEEAPEPESFAPNEDFEANSEPCSPVRHSTLGPLPVLPTLPKSKSVSCLPLGRAPPLEPLPPPPSLHLHSIQEMSPVNPAPLPMDRVVSAPPPSPVLPDFAPILVSALPPRNLNLSQMIVSLETDTVTYRAKLDTLISRPSKLATYLTSLLFDNSSRENVNDDVVSEFSSAPPSPFTAIYRTHVNGQKSVTEAVPTLHVFLDRPGAPYEHVLHHLRTPSAHLAALPHTVRLSSRYAQSSGVSSDRLDALLTLRDEARFLDLDELQKLCARELVLVATGLSAGAQARPSPVSLHASASVHTLTRSTSLVSSSSQPSQQRQAAPAPVTSTAAPNGTEPFHDVPETSKLNAAATALPTTSSAPPLPSKIGTVSLVPSRLSRAVVHPPDGAYPLKHAAPRESRAIAPRTSAPGIAEERVRHAKGGDFVTPARELPRRMTIKPQPPAGWI